MNEPNIDGASYILAHSTKCLGATARLAHPTAPHVIWFSLLCAVQCQKSKLGSFCVVQVTIIDRLNPNSKH